MLGGACRVEPRITRWSDAAFDIRALRKGAKDGPLALAQDDRALVAASLAVSTIKNDDAGSFRMIKSSNNTARDDVAAALALVAGAYARDESKPKRARVSGHGVTNPAVDTDGNQRYSPQQ